MQTQSVEDLQRKMRIAKELSDLVFYCYSVPFRDFETSTKSFPYNAMSSWNEKKAAAVCAERGPNADAAGFNAYCRRQIARVYPHGRRLDSSNFDPQQMWNCGIQLVRLSHKLWSVPRTQAAYWMIAGCSQLSDPWSSDVVEQWQISTEWKLWLSTQTFRSSEPGYCIQPPQAIDFQATCRSSGSHSHYSIREASDEEGWRQRGQGIGIAFC